MALTPRHQRFAYRTGTLALLMVACGFGWLTYESLAASEAIASIEAPIESPPVSAADPDPLRLDPNAACWRRDLRRPLYDPPPPPPPPKKAPPPIRAQLVGAIVEPGGSTAMIRLPSGQVEFRRVGEPLGPQDPGAVIESILADRITVARDGEVTELSIQAGR